MNILISGGCKNGKSFFAQEEAKRQADEKGLPLYYLATMIPSDEEDRARIRRHVRERAGWGFTTIEQGINVCGALEKADPEGVFLLDSVTALLSNEMFASGGEVDLQAPKRVSRQLAEFAERTGNTVFVSDFIYSDAAGYEALTEEYRKGLALCDRTLAKLCGQVIEVCYGNRYYFK
ncbi:bifunctional adenosylcobinamide kinase/adenosylcobinamide-phosphate guanylyltransferase [bacterium 210820-DFI.6.37]|nr:bifunctional adenosylcobinamide kinase/adenosylcobinamide-phosphate guanylyltransferase [bacterium 210820-DFI.6.37]